VRQLEYWNEHAGESWAENADALESINAASGADAMRRARARPGEVVLDVGCGTGATTLALGRAVAPGGRVTGVDLSAPMIREARRAQAELDVPGIEFLEADVELARFEPASVDVVFSRMCLMLLDNPAAGLGALRRALRPGGRLLATAFRDIAENPWLPLAVIGAAPFIGALPPLPLPGEPGPFTFADPDVPRALLQTAGFVDIEIVAVDTAVTPSGSPEDVAALLIQLGPAGGPYRRATPDRRARARQAVAALLGRFADDAGRVTLPNATWTISARRPDSCQHEGTR